MPITGNIKTFYLSSLLQMLCMDKKTGILRLANGEEHVEVFLREGAIIYASGSSKVERLGNFLRSEGIISEQDLEKYLQISRQKNQRLGKVLVEEGIISMERLDTLIHDQVEQTLLNLFMWEEGAFEYEDEEFHLRNQLITSLDTMEVVLEASRRVDEITVIKKQIPQKHAVLTITGDQERRRQTSLNTAERALLSLINGRRTIKRLISDSGYDDFTVYKILYSLITSGLIMKNDEQVKRSEGVEKDVAVETPDTPKPASEENLTLEIESAAPQAPAEEISAPAGGADFELTLSDDEAQPVEEQPPPPASDGLEFELQLESAVPQAPVEEISVTPDGSADLELTLPDDEAHPVEEQPLPPASDGMEFELQLEEPDQAAAPDAGAAFELQLDQEPAAASAPETTPEPPAPAAPPHDQQNTAAADGLPLEVPPPPEPPAVKAPAAAKPAPAQGAADMQPPPAASGRAQPQAPSPGSLKDSVPTARPAGPKNGKPPSPGAQPQQNAKKQGDPAPGNASQEVKIELPPHAPGEEEPAPAKVNKRFVMPGGIAAAVVAVAAAAFFLLQPAEQPPPPKPAKQAKKTVVEKKQPPKKASAKKTAAAVKQPPPAPKEPTVEYEFFQDKNSQISVNLPAGGRVTERTAAGTTEVLFSYPKDTTLKLAIMRHQDPWNAEDEMYEQILKIKEGGRLKIDRYRLIEAGGCPGYMLTLSGLRNDKFTKTALYRFSCYNKFARLEITSFGWRTADGRALCEKLFAAIEKSFLIYP